MRWVIRLYPRAWRDRYGAEVEALLEDSGTSTGQVWNLLVNAVGMRLRTGAWRPVAALALAGLGVASVAAWRMPDQYVSEATVVVRPAPVVTADRLWRDALKMRATALSSNTLRNVLSTTRAGFKSKRSWDDLEADLGARLRIEAHRENGAVALTIESRGKDAEEAQTVASHMMRLMYVARDFSAAQGGARNAVDVAAFPTVQPRIPEPMRAVMVAGGLLAGLLAGLALLLARRHARWVFGGAAIALALFGASFVAPWRHTSRAELLFANPAAAAEALQRSAGLLTFPPEMEPPGLLESIRVQPGHDASLVVEAVSTDRRRAQNLAFYATAKLMNAQPERADVVGAPALPPAPPIDEIRAGLLAASLILALLAWSGRRLAPTEAAA